MVNKGRAHQICKNEGHAGRSYTRVFEPCETKMRGRRGGGGVGTGATCPPTTGQKRLWGGGGVTRVYLLCGGVDYPENKFLGPLGPSACGLS